MSAEISRFIVYKNIDLNGITGYNIDGVIACKTLGAVQITSEEHGEGGRECLAKASFSSPGRDGGSD